MRLLVYQICKIMKMQKTYMTEQTWNIKWKIAIKIFLRFEVLM